MTRRELLAANPGLAMRMRTDAERKNAFNARAVEKMAEIVKAAKSAGRIKAKITDADIADISAYLRDFAAMQNGSFIAGVMSRTPGLNHCG